MMYLALLIILQMNWRRLLSNDIIKINALDYSYRPGSAVLKNVNLTVQRGESCCILGPNGGGKTTLLRLLLGFIEPDSGTIEILGDSVHNVRHKIGYMPQVQNIDSDFPVTVIEVVMMGTLCGCFGSFFSGAMRMFRCTIEITSIRIGFMSAVIAVARPAPATPISGKGPTPKMST